jgi:hypothetical protein
MGRMAEMERKFEEKKKQIDEEIRPEPGWKQILNAGWR